MQWIDIIWWSLGRGHISLPRQQGLLTRKPLKLGPGPTERKESEEKKRHPGDEDARFVPSILHAYQIKNWPKGGLAALWRAAYLGSDALTRRGTSRKNLTDFFQVKSHTFSESRVYFSTWFISVKNFESALYLFLRNADNVRVTNNGCWCCCCSMLQGAIRLSRNKTY